MTLIGGQEQDDSCVNALEKGKAMGQGRGGKGVWRKGGGKGQQNYGYRKEWANGPYWRKGNIKGKGEPKGGTQATPRNDKGEPIFTGNWYRCGKQGHSAKFCPKAGKGFAGKCFTCGQKGHQSRLRPQGKEKGVNEVEEQQGSEEGGDKTVAEVFGGVRWDLHAKRESERTRATQGDCIVAGGANRRKGTRIRRRLGNGGEVKKGPETSNKYEGLSVRDHHDRGRVGNREREELGDSCMPMW
jgi:hypothetical protein